MDQALARRIGDEAEYTAPDELGAAAIRYFAFATEDDNPLYRDAAVAAETRHGGLIAPPTLICETNQFAEGQANMSEYLGHDWHLPLEGMRIIRGGNDYEFFRPVRPDDRVTVRPRRGRLQRRCRAAATMRASFALPSISRPGGRRRRLSKAPAS